VTDAQPDDQQPEIMFEVIVPEAMSAGVYANGFGSWFNATDFTLDFFVHLPITPQTDDSGEPYLRAQVQVVSRVKIPPPIIFRLIQQLNASMTEYEQMFGDITSLGDPIPPSPDLGDSS
jgi:hypothetical protein